MLACGIGAPPEVVAEAKRRGKLTLALIGSPHHVARALSAGVDVIVAQGYDAGAHTGPIGTYSLVPQIVDLAGEIPVLVAGGVAAGRHVAALAMGAREFGWEPRGYFQVNIRVIYIRLILRSLLRQPVRHGHNQIGERNLFVRFGLGGAKHGR